MASSAESWAYVIASFATSLVAAAASTAPSLWSLMMLSMSSLFLATNSWISSSVAMFSPS